ncbi:MAG: lytic transglycosylase F, partial [Tangfeifania sp.]
MGRYSAFLIGFMFFLSACESQPGKNEKSSGDETKMANARTLEKIKNKGKLTALTTYSGTSYFLYRGQAMGFEYELLKRFADHLDVELEVIVSKNIDSL